MGPIRRFDHVGITVDDLEAVKAFFVALGLEPDGESQIVEGEFVSTVVGIDDVRVEVVMLRS
jgi:catechol 2,3-dioxygenase-like lactoylglutathione lyase family enzyme